jgi:hypothetical protein
MPTGMRGKGQTGLSESLTIRGKEEKEGKTNQRNK